MKVEGSLGLKQRHSTKNRERNTVLGPYYSCFAANSWFLYVPPYPGIFTCVALLEVIYPEIEASVQADPRVLSYHDVPGTDDAIGLFPYDRGFTWNEEKSGQNYFWNIKHSFRRNIEAQKLNFNVLPNGLAYII